MKLKLNEKFIILSLRYFHDFFSKYSYLISDMSYNDRSGDYIRFRSFNEKWNITVSITEKVDSLHFDIVFSQNPSLFSKGEIITSLSEQLEKHPEYSNITRIDSADKIEEVIKDCFDFTRDYLISFIRG